MRRYEWPILWWSKLQQQVRLLSAHATQYYGLAQVLLAELNAVRAKIAHLGKKES